MHSTFFLVCPDTCSVSEYELHHLGVPIGAQCQLDLRISPAERSGAYREEHPSVDHISIREWQWRARADEPKDSRRTIVQMAGLGSDYLHALRQGRMQRLESRIRCRIIPPSPWYAPSPTCRDKTLPLRMKSRRTKETDVALDRYATPMRVLSHLNAGTKYSVQTPPRELLGEMTYCGSRHPLRSLRRSSVVRMHCARRSRPSPRETPIRRYVGQHLLQIVPRVSLKAMWQNPSVTSVENT